MKKIRIFSIYNNARLNNKKLFNFTELKTMIPTFKDEDGNSIDGDFISYYELFSDIFDKYIKYNHGSKIFSYYEEDFDSALNAFQDESAAFASKYILEYSSEFAKNMKKLKLINNPGYVKIQNLGEILKTDTLGPTELFREYDEDSTTNSYGAQSGSTTLGTRHSSNLEYNKAYDSGNLVNNAKSEQDSNSVTDTSSAAAHSDSVIRAGRTDAETTTETVNTYTTNAVTNQEILKNYSDYYDLLEKQPELRNIINSFLNQLIIEMGCSYEY